MQEVTFPGCQLRINFTFLTHKLALICNHVSDEIKLRESLKDVRKKRRFQIETSENHAECVKVVRSVWCKVWQQLHIFSSIYGQFLEFVMKNIAISLISIILDLKILKEFKQKIDREAKIHNCLYFLFNSYCQSFISGRKASY